MNYFVILLITMGLVIPVLNFKETQLTHQRVADAYREKEKEVIQLFNEKKIQYAGFTMFIRAFKKERQVEVWVKGKDVESWTLLVTYPFCSTSGTLGPKRKEGDGQIPEGVYHINHFNPLSNFHLSLGVNYPNRSDRILSDQQHPGSNIYIHGNCVTIGCIPITDQKIKELYLLAVEAKNNGQEEIPVHIFPARLVTGTADELAAAYSVSEKVHLLWKSMEPVYQQFESTRQLLPVRVDDKGMYHQ